MRLGARGLLVDGCWFPCSIGRGGLTGRKREGDGATPKGRHRIVGLLYRPDRMAAPTPWAQPIRRGDLWSDDPDRPGYNHLQRAPFAGRHERLWRGDRLYDLVLVTDWNWPDAVPGRGSAIFVHRWRRKGYPTEGCLAFAPAQLHRIAQRAVPGRSLIIE